MTTQEAPLTDYELKAPERARHRALISKIVHEYPGLTIQQIIDKEKELFGYTFLTDNRLREMKKPPYELWSEKGQDGLLRWYPKT